MSQFKRRSPGAAPRPLEGELLPPSSNRSVGEWPNRPTPPVVNWQPRLPANWMDRWAARRLTQGFDLSSEVVQAGTRFYEAAQRLEKARQDLELAHARRALLPLQIAHERLVLEQALGKAMADLEAVQADLLTQRAWRTHRQLLSDEEFRLEVLRRQAERQELEGRMAVASAQAAFAAKIGQRRGEAELHRSQEGRFRAQMAAERERNRRDEERGRSRDAEPAGDEMPEPLRRHYATEQEVHANVTEAQRRAQAIRDRAAAQRRNLTNEEIEEIDALEDAAQAAADSIRRGAASDLGA
jgi:hypothetical protein